MNETQHRRSVIEQDLRFQSQMREAHFPDRPKPKPPEVPKLLVSPPSSPMEMIPEASWQRIVRQIARQHNVSVAELIGRRRAANIVAARHHACYQLAVLTGMSLPAIGRHLGNRDHTSILHGIRRHALKIGDLHRAGPAGAPE